MKSLSKCCTMKELHPLWCCTQTGQSILKSLCRLFRNSGPCPHTSCSNIPEIFLSVLWESPDVAGMQDAGLSMTICFTSLESYVLPPLTPAQSLPLSSVALLRMYNSSTDTLPFIILPYLYSYLSDSCLNSSCKNKTQPRERLEESVSATQACFCVLS